MQALCGETGRSVVSLLRFDSVSECGGERF